MRYAKEHKEQTRDRILHVAAQRFREHGFEGIGVQGLMQESGLTNGAFYNHFASKEDLARQTVEQTAAERLALFKQHMEAGSGVRGHVERYLSASHRDHPGRGCPSAALSADVARQGLPVREAFSNGLNTYLDYLAGQWPQLDHKAARARAINLHSLMSGALQLARASSDEALSQEILAAAREQALDLIADAKA